jgi:hypothetical protein
MKYNVEAASDGMIYIQIFMKIIMGIQVILKLLPRNLRGCSVGITIGKGV